MVSSPASNSRRQTPTNAPRVMEAFMAFTLELCSATGVQERYEPFSSFFPHSRTLRVWFQYPRVHPYASALDTRATPSTSPVHSLLTPSRRVTRAGQMPCFLGPQHIRRAMQAREQGGEGCRRCMRGGAADAARRGRWDTEAGPGCRRACLIALNVQRCLLNAHALA